MRVWAFPSIGRLQGAFGRDGYAEAALLQARRCRGRTVSPWVMPHRFTLPGSCSGPGCGPTLCQGGDVARELAVLCKGFLFVVAWNRRA